MVSTMSRLLSQIVFLLVLLCFLEVGESKVIRCIEAERQALLKIKQDLHELKEGFLSSWGDEEEKRECCEWHGVRCANKTGHVILLDLSPPNYKFPIFPPEVQVLRGNISYSLTKLKHLTHLDLSLIDFQGNRIPNFIGSLSKLKYLSLFYTFISGDIPPRFSNLSSLEFLNLSYNYDLTIKSFESVFCLSSLRNLDMSSTNLSSANDWFQVVNKLPHLSILRLQNCYLPNTIPFSLSSVNSSTSLAILELFGNQLSAAALYKWIFTFSHSLVHLDLSATMTGGHIPEALLRNLSTLEYLDLESNELKGVTPDAFGSMTSLSFLCLSYNELEGSIPEALGNLTSLTHLDLSLNNLEGDFPKSLWNLCLLRELYAQRNKLSRLQFPEQTELLSRCSHHSLQNLYLSHNQIQGSLPNLTLFSSLKRLRLPHNRFSGVVPESIGQLGQLEILILSSNSLEGPISEAHFSRLSKLYKLYLDDNSLILNMSSNWVPSFRLNVISLGSCKLGPQFPKWLQTQKNYSILDMSNSGISDSIPYWFWGVSTIFVSINISHNQIHGTTFSNSSVYQEYVFPSVDLSSNNLEGSIPCFLFEVGSLNLSTNGFSELNSTCNVSDYTSLEFLDISSNQLSGELPDFLLHFKELMVLVLSNNKMSGQIPFSIGSLTKIETLHLRNNFFTNKLPSTLKNCTELTVLDVGENRLSGPIPIWIGEIWSNLVILSLRSNNFSGRIPSSICLLEYLQLLDLSSNNVSGSIPRCLSNLTSMKSSSPDLYYGTSHYYHYSNPKRWTGFASYEDEVELLWKGKVSKFGSNLGLVICVDLSSNKLMGEIPTEITELVGLIFLNLSRNSLGGKIPSEIGKLTLLDALDLSNNQLSGSIPSSLSKVDRLNTFDVSNNKLSGKIPTGTQLQSFGVNSYSRNPELCGDPLPKRCPSDEPSTPKSPTARNEESRDKFVTQGFYISIGVGFVVGFWGACASLIFNKTWRYSHFNFLT